MLETFLIIFFAPFFIIGCIIGSVEQKRRDAERKSYLENIEKEQRERARKLEAERQQRVQREELEKKASIERFHKNIFPVETENPSVSAVWGRYPSGLHDMPEKIERQKKALYKTTPVLISTGKMVGFFYPSFDSDYHKVYRTSLVDCTCPDYAKHTGPCKHIYRLFYELNHKYSPGIIDVDPVLEGILLNISESDFYDLVGKIRYPSASVSMLTEANKQLANAGILLAKRPSEDQYRELLNSMTKDQIILSLAKKNVTGYCPSWSKFRLITWIIETQPKYLAKQFRDYVYLTPSPLATTWIDGVKSSFAKYHYYMADSEFNATFSNLKSSNI